MKFRTLNKSVVIAVGFALVLGFVGIFGSTSNDIRTKVERKHGIRLSRSAREIQYRGDSRLSLLDRGAASLFLMSTNDADSFLAQLTIKSRTGPAHVGPGDPTANGWNVWPEGSPTFVPANLKYGGFKRTWSGDAVPIEMLSCASTTGD